MTSFSVACRGRVVSASDSSSGGQVIGVWVRVPVATLVSLSKALNHNCLVKIGEVVLSALPARLLMDDTQAYNPYRL